MTLGQRIAQIRNEHLLTQEEFGERLGTTRQTVSRWELDQSLPELSKIVQISKIFSVTTDSMLRDGISTFDIDTGKFSCGVWRSTDSEIVETEKYSLVLFSKGQVFGMELYSGFENKKRLIAVCERDQTRNVTEYAFLAGEKVVSNCGGLSERLGEDYDSSRKDPMRRLESFQVDHSGEKLPTVSEAGIPGCLKAWRIGDSLSVSADNFIFLLCTGKTEYVFSIIPEDDNIYCGASYNIVFDLGLFGGRQYFRIRNYKDNSEKFCRFSCDFTYEAKEIEIPTAQCELGRCSLTEKGLAWTVKRYTDDTIVLQGCGDDEYTYRRDDRHDERFVPESV